MTKYEELLAEYDDELIIEEHHMLNEGLYSDGIAWIKKDMTSTQKRCVLAEEIGHYKTSSGDILNLHDIDNIRQELKARRWAYEKILPIDLIVNCFKSGICTLWELAEHLEVDEKFLKEALESYGLL